MKDLWLLHERSLDIKKTLCRLGGNHKKFRLYPPVQGKIPRTELSGWEESEDMKCHVATTGSILDFVGDRVHG